MASLIGALRVSLSAETAAFEAGMKRAQKQAWTSSNAMSKSLGLVKASFIGLAGALSIGLFTRAISSALEYAGSLAEVAQQLGVTTKDLQVFRFAAGQVGVSQEQLEVGLSKLTITLGKVAAGAKEPAKALAAIGISVDQVRGKDAGQAFRLIADGLGKIPDRAQRAAVEVALFGKTGSKLDNLLAGGSKALDELTSAAERLGIVLSDEQIAKADETADKLGALQTVLKARIAGVVADNADAILDLANALVSLVSALGSVVSGLSSAARAFQPFGAAASSALERLFPFLVAAQSLGGLLSPGKKLGSSATVKLAPARDPSAIRTGNVGQFLAGGGGSKKGRVDHSAEQALRQANQFDQDTRRAQMDVLRATQSLASDYVQRSDIAIQLLDLERAAYKAQLDYEVASKDKSKAQAASLLALYDQKDSLERQAELADRETERQEQYEQTEQLRANIALDLKDAQANLAETAEERRKVELEILELAYEERRRRLQRIIQESKDEDERHRAWLELNSLPAMQAADRAGVIQNTRGPMEDYLASLPTTAAKANEALERLQVEGMEGFLDSILALSDGLDSAADSLLQTLKNFLLGLARMELQKGLGSLLGSSGGLGGIVKSIFGGGSSAASSAGASLFTPGLDLDRLPGYASGGMGIFKGIPGIDRNVVSINGIPQFRVSHGEPFNIGNDNSRRSGRGGNTQIFNFPNSDADSFRRNQSQTARVARRSLRV